MFSPRIERALQIAVEAHHGQVRKGDGDCPYVVHPLHVAILLARWGMDEDVIVAGLVHDVVEDCDAWTLARIESEFGSHVAGIVGELTEDKSRSWAERKQHGIEKVSGMSPQAASVKAADKIHNLESLCAQLRVSGGEALWSSFRGGRDGTLRVARELVEALSQRVDPRVARALARAFEAVVAADEAHRERVRAGA